MDCSRCPVLPIAGNPQSFINHGPRRSAAVPSVDRGWPSCTGEATCSTGPLASADQRARVRGLKQRAQHVETKSLLSWFATVEHAVRNSSEPPLPFFLCLKKFQGDPPSRWGLPVRFPHPIHSLTLPSRPCSERDIEYSFPFGPTRLRLSIETTALPCRTQSPLHLWSGYLV
ncbi:hypothetical protein LZ32DRAFT_127276 [Colletotrichum eremochloae]|nr:hypothetical protein LZ32DRAFT_127276 [Colletotrichum eremochloae]